MRPSHQPLAQQRRVGVGGASAAVGCAHRGSWRGAPRAAFALSVFTCIVVSRYWSPPPRCGWLSSGFHPPIFKRPRLPKGRAPRRKMRRYGMIKRMLRWLVRMIAIVIVLSVIGHIINWWSHRVAPDSVLVLSLKGPVIERGTDGLRGLVADNQTPLNVARRTLREAASDPRIVGLAVRITDPEMEFAQAQELSGLIREFAAHNKWTTAYLESAGDFGSGNLPYLVASAAGEVSMMPEGEINLMGVHVQELFARGLLDKVGIRPNFAALGKYKSAGNIFTEKDFTPPQREEDEALVNGLFN